MKHCPVCNRNYRDETLNFCLDDGEWLIDATGSGEPATAILTSDAPTRVLGTPTASEPNSQSKVFANRNPIIIGVVLLSALAVAGYWLYGGRPSKQIGSIAVMPFVNQGGDPDIEY